MARAIFSQTDVWELEEELGRGGAGVVYLATSETGERAVVKLIPKLGAPKREVLMMPQLANRRNIVPILAIGENDEGTHIALLMPKADGSLRKYIDSLRGKPDRPEHALSVLLDIAHGIASLAQSEDPQFKKRGIVHRDLKPENVLYLDEVWCLSDFGIARYHDRKTGPNTQRAHKTDQYASPEQFRGETATALSDVYAFGVIAYELLMGSLPFKGPHFRIQHLEEQPPAMTGVSGRLATIVLDCLCKTEGVRPTPSELVRRLQDYTSFRGPVTAGMTALQAANLAEVKRSEEIAERERQRREAIRRRKELTDASIVQLDEILSRLQDAVRENAPRCTLSDHSDGWQAKLNGAFLTLSGFMEHRGKLDLPFDVIASCHVAVSQQAAGSIKYIGIAHSLWFCDKEVKGRYQWYEAAFSEPDTVNPGNFKAVPMSYIVGAAKNQVLGKYIPFAAAPNAPEARMSFRVERVIGRRCDLVKPLAPVRADMENFVDHWISKFADAAQENLRLPVAVIPSIRPARQLPPARVTRSKRPPLRIWRSVRRLGLLAVIIISIFAIPKFIQAKNESDARQFAADQVAVEQAAKDSGIGCFTVLNEGVAYIQDTINSKRHYLCDGVPAAMTGTKQRYLIAISVAKVTSDAAVKHGLTITCLTSGENGEKSIENTREGGVLQAIESGTVGTSGAHSPQSIDCTVKAGANTLRTFNVALTLDPNLKFDS